MKIAIVGAGALGLYYGAMLQRAGNDVRFLLRRDYQAIRKDGLSVTSPNGDFHLQAVQCALDPAELGPVDLVLVGLKTFANHRLIELVAPLMQDDTCVLTLQNGLGNEELLAKTFGAERVLGGIAFLCSNRGEPGTVHHMGQGRIRLGELSGGFSERATALARMFNQAQVPCEAVDDLRRARWEKLVWNIPFNGLSALTGKNVTELLRHEPSRREIIAIMGEVIAAGNAQDLNTPIEAEIFIEKMISATETMDGYRPSMMIDRLEGHPLELEAIYGVPLTRATACGVEMVRVRMLHALLELGERN
ncbi:2-dehydropantoate 2-reductase [Syntrophotalea acetylenivorans]|uniref:2-dehydropantoate 2-reductase n=1 Tax=Syntrophotalea acetylenivorans TaxID=1842532 RepID=A0A1L3GQM3_9BACT|nr:putative 2-dehydropantoate 2-reductase [Syntrophotalea acetylenivorans]APG28256.1 2-dehydropantoate 2-reductase [Syntrophotalea acetylenivorans]